MTIKILISALCLIMCIYLTIKTSIQINKIDKDIKRVDEMVEQLIQESIEALEHQQILCKDCKHWYEWSDGTGSCHRSDIMWVGTDCDDYCSLAEGR